MKSFIYLSVIILTLSACGGKKPEAATTGEAVKRPQETGCYEC